MGGGKKKKRGGGGGGGGHKSQSEKFPEPKGGAGPVIEDAIEEVIEITEELNVGEEEEEEREENNTSVMPSNDPKGLLDMKRVCKMFW